MKNKRIVTVLLLSLLLWGCKNETASESIETQKDELPEEGAFQKELRTHKVEQKEAAVYPYKFGEPSDKKILVYTSKYDTNGYLIDSTVYKKNKQLAREHFEYNNENKLIKRELYDSLDRLVSVLERQFDQKGREIAFKAFRYDTIRYSQRKAYDKEGNMVKITDYYNDGTVKNISKYSYNSKGKVTMKEELDEYGNLLYKEIIGYDSKGNKTRIEEYDSTNTCMGKTVFKKYDTQGNVLLIEKIDENDSIYAKYEFKYNENGQETENTIYNGINQILRKSISVYDSNGNRIEFKVYEGETGLLGTDKIAYNEQGKETETEVLNGKGELVSRKVKIYNDKGLIEKEINYNKLNEPEFEFRYEYRYR